MSKNEKWGFGKGDTEPFAITWLGKNKNQQLELLWGEHPHSRSNDNMYARTPSGTIFEFAGHRALIDIEFKSYNYLKESELSGDQIRKGGICKIISDKVPVYLFLSGCRTRFITSASSAYKTIRTSISYLNN